MKKKSKVDKENQKVVNKIVIGIVIYAIFMAILILMLNPKEEVVYDNKYLIIDDVYFYQYVDGEIKEISSLDTDYENYLFDIYSKNEFKGSYHVADIEYEYVRYRRKGSSGLYRPEVPYIALTQNMDIVEYEKEKLSTEDVNKLTNLMYSKDVYDITNINSSYKITLDLDDDDIDETIYFATNYDYSEIPETAFSIVYINDENGITVLEENYVTAENIFNIKQYGIDNIVELENDGYYTVVISSSDMDETSLLFYSSTGNIYKRINSD